MKNYSRGLFHLKIFHRWNINSLCLNDCTLNSLHCVFKCTNTVIHYFDIKWSGRVCPKSWGVTCLSTQGCFHWRKENKVALFKNIFFNVRINLIVWYCIDNKLNGMYWTPNMAVHRNNNFELKTFRFDEVMFWCLFIVLCVIYFILYSELTW